MNSPVNAPAALVELPPPLRESSRFLEPGAEDEQLIHAAAINHVSWFAASLPPEGEVHREPGVTWISAPEGTTIAFPSLPARSASERLDAILGRCREQNTLALNCWSLLPTRPLDLGARLVARNFEWGWQPHWMALDLRHVIVDYPVPADLRVTVEDDAAWALDDLPYYTPRSVGQAGGAESAAPRRSWHFAARVEGAVVGHAWLHVTTGRRGVAGIYSVGVRQAARGQGVGRAVTAAACQFAGALGCHFALLNSATSIYGRIGFRSLGYGQTWFLHHPAWMAGPPSPEQVALFEAVGRGDLRALDREFAGAGRERLDMAQASGITPLGLAALMQQHAAAEWLVRHGATPDIVPLWDLGWADRLPAIIHEQPEIASRAIGQDGLTALHQACNRGDVELARLALTGKADLDHRDPRYGGTPADWARVLGQPEISALIKAHQAL